MENQEIKQFIKNKNMTSEKNLPRQVRSHQLQEEHKRAFIKILPLQWICEFIPQENDYGLDGRIEIFDQNGYTTGKMFFFQLKGTDEPVLKKALACQLKVKHLEYYRSLDLPILIVRYCSHTKKMYVRWFDTYSHCFSINFQQDFTFSLSEKDEWQNQTVVELVTDLKKIIRLRLSNLQALGSLPINLEEIKNFPQRSRSHQLQEEQRRAFLEILPLHWICEFIPQENDYGLDGRIEIFDQNGYTTGKMFFFQLKGTDKSVLKKALACKLKVKHLEYYRLLDLPVLIVNYHSHTKKTYVKWFHTYDPYYGRNAEKEFTFRLSEENEWQDKTIVELVANLEAFIILRSSSFKPPVNLSINFEEEMIRGLLPIEVEIELRKTVEKINRLVSINPSYSLNKDTHGRITVRKKNIEIYLHNGTGFTLHNYQINQEIDLSVLCYDILIGIAVALEKTGQSNIAAQIIAEIAAYSSMISYREILLIAVHCMAHANRVIEALQLAEKLMETRDLIVASQILSLVAQTQRKQLLEQEKTHLQSFLRFCIGKAIKQEKNDVIIATAHYNYGNYLKTKQPQSRTDLRFAVHHYRKASKFDVSYWDKPYFCRELAGILFESQRYALSVKLYKCVLDLGEEGMCQALYADALMFAGEYHLALQAFKTYFDSNVECEPEYRLKAFALKNICSMFKIEKQKRKTQKAVQLSTRDDNLSPSEYRGKLQQALNYDALCSIAWFNLGVLESILEHQESSLFSFLFAAIINKSDLEAWCNAIGIGMFTDKQSLLKDMICVAQQNHRNNFMAQMIKVVQNQSIDFPTNQILSLLYNISGQVLSRKEKLTIRYNSH